jgi:hypothetical protein
MFTTPCSNKTVACIAYSTLSSLIIMALYMVSPPVFAQFTQKQVGGSGPTIKLDPPYPAPGEEVIAKLTSVHNVGASHITWKQNGVVVQESDGGVEYTFTAGPAGSLIQLSAAATAGLSAPETAQKTIVVNDVFVVWEGRTYTPPLFRGRGLMSPGSTVTAVVVPSVYDTNGNVYDPKKLIYTWRIDADAKPYAVGTGLTSVSIKNERLFKPIRVSVSIQNAAGAVVASTHTNIPPIQPEVLLYEDSKLLGARYANPLHGEYTLSASEVTILSEPYYMSTATRDAENLQYVWQIGSATETNPGSIILRSEGVGSGRATLGVTISNHDFVTQRIRGELSVIFNTNSGGSKNDPNTIAI